MLLGDHDRITEIVAEQHAVDVGPAGVHRWNGVQDQRHGDYPRTFLRWPGVRVRIGLMARARRRLVRLRIVREHRLDMTRYVEPLLTMERKEQHPEAIERGDEDADGH